MRNKTVVESKVTRRVHIVESNPTYGDVFDKEEFFDMVAIGAFTPDDGIGWFMIGNDVTDISVWGVDFESDFVRQFDKVHWLNK